MGCKQDDGACRWAILFSLDIIASANSKKLNHYELVSSNISTWGDDGVGIPIQIGYMETLIAEVPDFEAIMGRSLVQAIKDLNSRIFATLGDAFNTVQDYALDVLGSSLMLDLQRLSKYGVLDMAYPANIAMSNANHRNNVQYSQAIREAGFIYSQSPVPQGELLLGAFGNGDMNGCGPFAVYNAILYLRGGRSDGDPAQTAALAPCPADIIRFIERNGGVNLGVGSIGTNPEVLMDYLRINGFRVRANYLPRAGTLDQQIRDAGAAILLYGRVIGGFFVHYVMVRYEPGDNGAPGVFWMYNELPRDSEPEGYSSIDRWFAIGRGNYENNNNIPSGYTMLTIISISH